MRGAVLGIGGSSTSSSLAARAIVHPWTISDTSTTANAT
jgi:hypothetical protein